MKYRPHEYQKFAVEFIKNHPISAIFLDCGLGKTIITLTAINDLLFDSFEISKVLVIAPMRVARDTWSAEIEKWEHLKLLTYSVAVGTAEERKTALQKQADIYIINRENIQWLIEESGIKFDYDMIITISMKATDYLKMPELIMSEYAVTLSDEEKQKYSDFRKELILELPDGEITAANAASLSNKLSQMANGAIYTDDKTIIPIHDRKLDALEDIIEAANGKSVLVAYWFKHDLERIKERLRKLHISFSTMDSSDSIRKWNSGQLSVALIHPASAGHGLNLQSSGSCLVWFGLTWSLELYQQTNARLWRQGQKAETVVIQHIVAKGTIDERILKALQEKDRQQSALMDAVKAELEESHGTAV